jgi:tetratricopeptide (TPR) repeat protein
MLYDSNYYTARYWNAWNEDDLAKSETAYQDLKQAIQWTDGFAVFIVHGAIQEHLKVFSRIERELRQFKFHQLEFSPKDSASLEQQLDNLPNSSELNAIFISTPDFRITTYSKHLKFRRELLYQKYQFCLIFFANREWSNDCLELCSWGWEIPTQGLPEFLGDYCDYCHWLELTKLDRIYEIQTFIADNNPPLPLRLSLLWEQGKILYSYGNHTAALAIYQELLTHQSQAIEVMRHMGYSLHQLGEFEQAITTFDRVLQQIPEDAKAWWNRGWALSKLQRWEAAIVAYEKALEYQPNHWWSQQMLCRALYQAQRYEAALTLCDEVLKHQPDESAVWNDRGIILFNLGRYLESITAYGHALKLNPSARVWKNRGYAD